jgi:leucine dehydrogenase
VGETLVDYLTKEGAIAILLISMKKTNEVGQNTMPNFRGTICTADVDIYAPCAMGATIK